MGFWGVWRKEVAGEAVAALAGSIACALLCAGCANPGPPRPPSLHLPAVVTDLAAERVGDSVLLRWTTPAVTTDNLAVKGAMTAQVCRETGPRPGTPAGRLAACAPILRLAVVSGPSQVADTLQPSLQSGPVISLTYRVQIFNAAERSAGDSAAALAASGSAPPPIENLKAVPGEHGAVLEWDAASGKRPNVVELRRVDLSTPAAKKAVKQPVSSVPRSRARNKPAAGKASEEHPDEVHLRVTETASAVNQNTAGTVDADAKIGDTYTYTAQRVQPVNIGAHALEIGSKPSPPVTITLRDIFPPARPAGLATISGITRITSQDAGKDDGQMPAATGYVDLSWEPNTEPDLAGYAVYRQNTNADGSPQGAMVKLTRTLVAAPAYRDVAVNPGQRYIYQITAVDASGNESAPSAQAQEVVTAGLDSPN